MIIKEILNKQLIRHYSDKGVTLLQVETGIEYDEAVDVIPCKFTYVETIKAVGEE